MLIYVGKDVTIKSYIVLVIVKVGTRVVGIAGKFREANAN